MAKKAEDKSVKDLKDKGLYEKISMVKAKIGKISKAADNPFFKSKYFDINGLLDHLEPLLMEHRLMTLQPVVNGFVVCKIIDVDNPDDVYESSLELPKLNDPQKVGSAITYYRRYGLQSMLGLQAEDDDGNKAGLKGQQEEAKKEEAAKAKKKADYIEKAVKLILSSKTNEEFAENCKKVAKVKGEQEVKEAALSVKKKLNPEKAEDKKEAPKTDKKAEAIARAEKLLKGSKTLEELKANWEKVKSVSKEEIVIRAKDAKKAELTK